MYLAERNLSGGRKEAGLVKNVAKMMPWVGLVTI